MIENFSKVLEIGEFPGFGRGMKAKSDIKIGQELISVPTSSLVTKTSVLQELNQFQLDHLSDIECLVFWLILSTSEKCTEYKKSLPTTFSVPFLFDSTNLSLLPSFIKEKVSSQNSMISNSFSALKDQLNCSFEQFKFFWAAVSTRCITFKGSAALAPVLDILNHSSNIKPVQIIQNDLNFTIKTNTSFSKGEQVFISYGPHDNIFLLTEYGFIQSDNQFDFYDCLNEFKELCDRFELVLEALDYYNIPSKLVVTRQGIGYPLQIAARLATIPLEMLQNYHELAIATRIHNDEQFSDELELKCSSLLESCLELARKRLGIIQKEQQDDNARQLLNELIKLLY